MTMMFFGALLVAPERVDGADWQAASAVASNRSEAHFREAHGANRVFIKVMGVR